MTEKQKVVVDDLLMAPVDFQGAFKSDELQNFFLASIGCKVNWKS